MTAAFFFYAFLAFFSTNAEDEKKTPAERKIKAVDKPVIQLIERDRNMDNQKDVFVYTQKNGKISLITVDRNFNGRVDVYHYYGNDERIAHTDIDTNHDGLIDRKIIYENNTIQFIYYDKERRGTFNVAMDLTNEKKHVVVAMDADYDGQYEQWRLFTLELRSNRPASGLSHRRSIEATQYNDRRYRIYSEYINTKKRCTFTQYHPNGDRMFVKENRNAQKTFQANTSFQRLKRRLTQGESASAESRNKTP